MRGARYVAPTTCGARGVNIADAVNCWARLLVAPSPPQWPQPTPRRPESDCLFASPPTDNATVGGRDAFARVLGPLCPLLHMLTFDLEVFPQQAQLPTPTRVSACSLAPEERWATCGLLRLSRRWPTKHPCAWRLRGAWCAEDRSQRGAAPWLRPRLSAVQIHTRPPSHSASMGLIKGAARSRVDAAMKHMASDA